MNADSYLNTGPDSSGKNADTTLRGNSLRRAMEGRVPTTLTPHEWEQWYAEQGVPDSHRTQSQSHKRPWWQFWKAES